MTLAAVGVDGCPAGWIAACSYGDARTELRLFADIADLADWRSGCFDEPAVALDLPMGLPEEPGLRRCDREARALLGPRRSCVFPSPPRWLLGAASFDEVQARVRSRGTPGLSQQSFRIMPRICQVDRFLAWESDAQDWLFEAHPEVSLATLAGRPMAASKLREEGRRERMRVLSRAFPDLRRQLAAAPWRRRDVGVDDMLDAYAVLWTARRVSAGGSLVLGGYERDRAGLVMRVAV